METTGDDELWQLSNLPSIETHSTMKRSILSILTIHSIQYLYKND
jgi:hypothetical protein